jgi:hypothetical protein
MDESRPHRSNKGHKRLLPLLPHKGVLILLRHKEEGFPLPFRQLFNQLKKLTQCYSPLDKKAVWYAAYP